MSVGGKALDTAPVHVSLQRRPTMMGLPQDAFLLLMLVIVTLSIAARLDPKVLVGCALAYAILLPFGRKLFEKDPFFMVVVPRALRYGSRYPRQAREVKRLWRDRVLRGR
ncbi:MAG: hypothetical protein F4246_02990 [Rhodothermaceae bacterium]|nr:hypothetical protein [Rhodothermaceae bacterium]MXX59836.1 hypothetical protein [Rhodothermaceae bacterium]MYD20470.1 hypothetical protein [Rhodothermaceae bacterium]MYD55963.1 hypothetical protein [Rhodothermaceae bacterium]MYI42676.1 hypothetical protein [Rhodothermaceae bacterium]